MIITEIMIRARKKDHDCHRNHDQRDCHDFHLESKELQSRKRGESKQGGKMVAWMASVIIVTMMTKC